jgi:hypothetical protein
LLKFKIPAKTAQVVLAQIEVDFELAPPRTTGPRARRVVVGLNDREIAHVFLVQPHARNAPRNNRVFRSVHFLEGCGRN